MQKLRARRRIENPEVEDNARIRYAQEKRSLIQNILSEVGISILNRNNKNKKEYKICLLKYVGISFSIYE